MCWEAAQRAKVPAHTPESGFGIRAHPSAGFGTFRYRVGTVTVAAAEPRPPGARRMPSGARRSRGARLVPCSPPSATVYSCTCCSTPSSTSPPRSRRCARFSALAGRAPQRTHENRALGARVRQNAVRTARSSITSPAVPSRRAAIHHSARWLPARLAAARRQHARSTLPGSGCPRSSMPRRCGARPHETSTDSRSSQRQARSASASTATTPALLAPTTEVARRNLATMPA